MLADPEAKIAEDYDCICDIPFEKGEGRPYRATFIIDKDGILRYKSVAAKIDDERGKNIDELKRLVKYF